jgi:fatty acid desaturase
MLAEGPVRSRADDHGELARRRLDAQRTLLCMLPRQAVVALHCRDLCRHALVALRVGGLGVLCLLALAQTRWPWLWPLAGLWQGVTILACTILLHEVVHDTVLPPHVRRRAPWIQPLLRWVYALPAALSPTQFERWHLDHHAHLGSATQDPKRAFLSPRRNARWLKALYFTPALFVLYSRAASRAVATYPSPLARRIHLERGLAIVCHLTLLSALVAWGGWWLALRVQLGPLLLAFPIWFALNRVGQHYDIDPTDPSRWSTRMRRQPLWEFVMLWSNYHHEHHAFPGVPFYNLAKLHRLMRAGQDGLESRDRGYRELLWDWIVRNQPPHTRWTSS